MDRDDALRLVEKLDTLADPTRGGTDAERAVAKRKAMSLRARFGLRSGERVRHTPPPRRFTASASGETVSAVWNVQTGEHSSNVKVHHYESPRSWKIEIFP